MDYGDRPLVRILRRSLRPNSFKVASTRSPAGHPESFESRFLGVPVDSSPEQVKLANPITYVQRGAPPFLILHGLSDRLIPWPQSRLLFEALQAAENEVTMLTFERLGHGFFNNSKLDFVDPAQSRCSEVRPAKRSSMVRGPTRSDLGSISLRTFCARIFSGRKDIEPTGLECLHRKGDPGKRACFRCQKP